MRRTYVLANLFPFSSLDPFRFSSIFDFFASPARRDDLLHAFVVCIGLVPHCSLKAGATLLCDLPLAFDVEVDRALLIKSWINAPAAAVGTVAAAGAVALAPRAAEAVAPGAGVLRLRAGVSAALGASLWWWTRGANRGPL